MNNFGNDNQPFWWNFSPITVLCWNSINKEILEVIKQRLN